MGRADDDQDRAAILARRRRFIALALAGIGGGCKQPGSTSSHAPRDAELPCATERSEPELFTLRECLEDLNPLPEPEPVPEGLDPEERSARMAARYEEGMLAFNEGRYDDAVIAWEAAYALSPQFSVLLLLAGDAAMRTERYIHARELYETYLGLPDFDPTSEEAQEAWAKLERLERRCEPRPSVCLESMPLCEPQPSSPKSRKRKRKR